MPNHVHFILWIRSVDVGAGVGASPAPTGCPGAVAPNGAGASPAPTGCPDAVAPPDKWIIPEPQRVNLNPRVGDVVGAFQSLVFKVYFDWIRIHDPTRRAKFWQRNYYEHIVRDERELKAIREYIRRNPAKWHADRDNADNIYHLAPPTTVEEYVREAMENA
ncbi:MAG TPA: hypothetical protein PLN71_16385 [Anaerolineae bacterium]|nr:hypothetical protein [Anaerolineae bacterium]